MPTLNRAPPIEGDYYVESTNARRLSVVALGRAAAHIRCLHIIPQMCCSTFTLCAGHSARRLPAVCPRGGAAHSPPSGDRLMNRARRPPLQHPLAPLFDRAVDSLGVSLSPDTTRHYRGTARNFLSYLGADHPEVKGLDQLRREPHILGWMSRLRSQVPPLGTASYINRLIALASSMSWPGPSNFLNLPI
jgi:hypothetical protein